MARSTVATDDFNRASLGSDYAQINAGLGGNVQINSSIRVVGQFSTQPVEDKATARRVTETFSNDQFASLAITNINDDIGSSEKVGVCVRCGAGTDGSKSMYTAYVTSGPAGNKTVTLDKWVSGTRTALHSASVAFTNNDTIDLEVLGTTLTVCKNGTALGGSFTQTDSSLTTGKPGIVVGASGTYGDNATFGDVTASTPVLTSPTGGTPGTTTITIGATSDSPSDGTMRFLRRVGGSAASAATIASTGESQSATANPQSRAMTGFTASSTNNFVDIVQVGAGGNSNVLTYGPFTMAAAGTAPSISVQPANQTVTAGATATFSVTASGSGTLAYQWRRNGTNISGAVSASYTTPATTVSGGTANSGDLYSVVVTGDTAPAATSSNATLTVNAAPGSFSLSVGPFGLNTGSGPLLGTAVSYTLTPGEVGAASGASINGTGTFNGSTGLLSIGSIPAAGVYSVQVKNADGSGRWHDVATAA